MTEKSPKVGKLNIHGRICYISAPVGRVTIKNLPDKKNKDEFGVFFTATLKDLLILSLRAQGIDFQGIADKLGYKTAQVVNQKLGNLSKVNGISITELVCRAMQLELLRPFALLGIAAMNDKLNGREILPDPSRYIRKSYSAIDAKYIAVIPTTRIYKFSNK